MFQRLRAAAPAVEFQSGERRRAQILVQDAGNAVVDDVDRSGDRKLGNGHLPMLAWVLVPFALLVALSRMVLGLHCPTDVLAGALIGGGMAVLSFAVVAPPL